MTAYAGFTLFFLLLPALAFAIPAFALAAEDVVRQPTRVWQWQALWAVVAAPGCVLAVGFWFASPSDPVASASIVAALFWLGLFSCTTMAFLLLLVARIVRADAGWRPKRSWLAIGAGLAISALVLGAFVGPTYQLNTPLVAYVLYGPLGFLTTVWGASSGSGGTRTRASRRLLGGWLLALGACASLPTALLILGPLNVVAQGDTSLAQLLRILVPLCPPLVCMALMHLAVWSTESHPRLWPLGLVLVPLLAALPVGLSVRQSQQFVDRPGLPTARASSGLQWHTAHPLCLRLGVDDIVHGDCDGLLRAQIPRALDGKDPLGVLFRNEILLVRTPRGVSTLSQELHVTTHIVSWEPEGWNLRHFGVTIGPMSFDELAATIHTDDVDGIRVTYSAELTIQDYVDVCQIADAGCTLDPIVVSPKLAKP